MIHHTDQKIFQSIVFAFNNEKIDIDLLDDAYDLDNIGEFDCNDFSRIRMIRDGN